MTTVNSSNFEQIIISMVEEALEKKRENANELVDKYSKEAVSRLKARSPVSNDSKPHYNASWRAKKDSKGWVYKKVIHSAKPFYRLTHLIEDGTVKRKTEAGSNRGIMPRNVHIRTVRDEIYEEIYNDLKSI